MTKTDLTKLIYNPSQVGRVGTAAIKNRIDQKDRGVGVPFGVKVVDEVMTPLLPGDLVALLARPGHGKTGTMMWWARTRARQIANGQAPDANKRVVIYVSYEQLVEELHMFHLAYELGMDVEKMSRGDLSPEDYKEVVAAGARRSAWPLWFLGLSNENRFDVEELDLEKLGLTLDIVEGGGERIIDSIFVDYLHAMPLPKAESKTVALDYLIHGMKNIGRRHGCPLIFAAQAKREVDDYAVPVPHEGDGQWCSSIEQRADKVIALCRPRKYKQEGETFGKDVPVIVEGDNQLLFYIWKQRFAKANVPVWLHFDPSRNEIAQMQMNSFQPNKKKSGSVDWNQSPWAGASQAHMPSYE